MRDDLHPSITATVPVSLGALAVAAHVSQRHNCVMISADTKMVSEQTTMKMQSQQTLCREQNLEGVLGVPSY